MNVALPLWKSGISPVLDTAGCLLVIESNAGRVISRRTVSLARMDMPERIRTIAGMADVLVCGAGSRPLIDGLIAAGVDVRPWIMGDAETIAKMVIGGKTPGGEYRMPGCRGKRWDGCGSGRGRRGRGRNQGCAAQQSRQRGCHPVNKEPDTERNKA